MNSENITKKKNQDYWRVCPKVIIRVGMQGEKITMERTFKRQARIQKKKTPRMF